MVLIPGTSSVAHLEENIASANIHLSQEEWKALAESPDIAAVPSFRY
jgi:aryl-alcohol dehydrogenase-like predicted oxidoreductase